MNILFKTIHGSRLYGLHHENSDYDWYTVIDKVKSNRKKYAKHSIVGDQDSMLVDFGTWINLCQAGVPQALEAMFSRKATIDKIEPFRQNFRVGYPVIPTILRTMKGIGEDDYKHKRHMFRLAYYIYDLRKYQYFNPTLSKSRVEKINRWAKEPLEVVKQDALTIAWA